MPLLMDGLKNLTFDEFNTIDQLFATGYLDFTY